MPLSDTPPPAGPVTSKYYPSRLQTRMAEIEASTGVDMAHARGNGQKLLVAVLETTLGLEGRVDDMRQDFDDHRAKAEERTRLVVALHDRLDAHERLELPIARANRRLAMVAILLVGAPLVTHIPSLLPGVYALVNPVVYGRLGITAEAAGVALMVGGAIFKAIGLDGIVNALDRLRGLRDDKRRG